MAGIFKAYDIRGRYPDELSEATARNIGNAFVRLLGAERIVVGRDMRLSSASLAGAFAEGAVEAGADVADAGEVSTPLLNYAIIMGEFDGGAMVTASHLPGEMNGFKLARENAVPLSGDRDLPLLETRVGEERVARAGGSVHEIAVLDDYIGAVAGFVRNPRPLTIVVDAGNGMVGPEVPGLFEQVPEWRLVPIYLEPDGRFPHHHANPLDPDTTRELQSRVVAEGADMGVAFDGDGDRCGFIDERGERVREDLVTGLIAEHLLREFRGDDPLRPAVEPGGPRGDRGSRPGRPLRVATPSSRPRCGEDALFAGELSGHYYYRDMGFTDNGLLTLVMVANILAASGRTLSELVEPLDRYPSTGEINLAVSDPAAVLAVLAARYRDADLDRLDGLTATYPDWWFNIRPSHTEPVVRLNIEADTRSLLDEKEKEVLAAIREAEGA